MFLLGEPKQQEKQEKRVTRSHAPLLLPLIDIDKVAPATLSKEVPVPASMHIIAQDVGK